MQPQPYGALRLAACEDLMVRRPQRDDLVLMANEETVLQDVIDKLIEIGRCYGMEMNVEKAKSNENFKTTIPSNNYDRPKTIGECGMF